MSDDFTWHENALKGTRGPIHDGEPQSGFYRQRRQDKTYEPVAYWKDTATGEQRCHINGKSVDLDRMMHTWPFASKNPISAEAYWHRIDTGQWLDNDAGAADSASGPEIDPALDPAGSLRAEIDAAKAGLPNYATIESDEAAARAQTLRSALTGLKGKAEAAYEERNRPLLDQQAALRKVWFALRDDAAGASDTIRKALGAWEDVKRDNARRAAKEAEDAAREVAQAHAKAVEEATKNNAPPPEPPAPPPPPVASNTPAPAAKIKGASGRAASVRLKKTVTAIDLEKAWQQFGGMPEVYNVLMDLAQKAVDAGIDCPCATVEEKSDVR